MRGVGVWWELGGILLPFFRVLRVPVRYLPYTSCPFFCLESGACCFFLSDFVTSGFGRVVGGGEECGRNAGGMREI